MEGRKATFRDSAKGWICLKGHPHLWNPFADRQCPYVRKDTILSFMQLNVVSPVLEATAEVVMTQHDLPVLETVAVVVTTQPDSPV